MDPFSSLALRLMFPQARAQEPQVQPPPDLQQPGLTSDPNLPMSQMPPPATPAPAAPAISPVQRFVQQRLQPAQVPVPEPVQASQDAYPSPEPLEPFPGPQAQPQAVPQASSAPSQPLPPGYGYFRQRYGWPEGMREDLAKAQAEDRDLMRSAQAGVSGNVAQMMVTGIPIDTTHNFARVGQATRQFIERAGLEQDEPALQQAQAGADSAVASSAAMQAMLTPGHPAYRALVIGALREDPTLADYGITPDSPAWMLGQVYAQRKPMVEQQGAKAVARAANANAGKAEVEAYALQLDNDPRNPAIPVALQSLAEVNPALARQAAQIPGVTMAQIAKVAGPALEVWKAKTDLAMKQQTYALDVAKWNLEVIGKTGAPPGWQLARNPQTGMPYRLLGEGEKASIAEAIAASQTVLKIVEEMKGLVADRGLTGIGADDKMARYQTLAGQLKLYAPKLWGQENEKYGKSFDAAMFDVLPTGKGKAWFIGESATHVNDKLDQLKLLATQGMAVRMKAMGLEPSRNADPKSFQENRR